jgi:hypothetical protein
MTKAEFYCIPMDNSPDDVGDSGEVLGWVNLCRCAAGKENTRTSSGNATKMAHSESALGALPTSTSSGGEFPSYSLLAMATMSRKPHELKN